MTDFMKRLWGLFNPAPSDGIRVLPSSGLKLEVTQGGSTTLVAFEDKFVSVVRVLNGADSRVEIYRTVQAVQAAAGGRSGQVEGVRQRHSPRPWAHQCTTETQANYLYQRIKAELATRATKAGRWRWLFPAFVGTLAACMVLLLFTPQPAAVAQGASVARAAVQPALPMNSAAALDPTVPREPAQALPRVTPQEAKALGSLGGQVSMEGKGPKFYIFSDPHCPFCKQLESALPSVSDSYVPVIVPLGYKGGSKDISAAVLCAADPAKAWRAAMAGTAPAGKVCPKGIAQVEENMRLFESMGLASTPTMITPQGTLVTGAATPSELVAVLQR